MRKIIIMFLGCVLASGCSKVSHLDQLLTLKDLAEEQEAANQYIEKQDRNFDLMLKEAKAGTLDQYSNKREIRQAFGDPVFARDFVEGDEVGEFWLYRYVTQYFGAEKIYLYFDNDGNLFKSEYKEEENGEIGQETSPENGLEAI